ncbi:phage tail tape measure protein, partial [Escherichia coli]|nr:phage tail tape measure protein [Escherichia coli]
GDIVFKHLPRALAVRGQWHEPVVAPSSGGMRALPQEEIQVQQWPTARPAPRMHQQETFASAFQGEIHVHLHGVSSYNPRELARMVGDAVRAEMNRMARAGTGSFRDRD